MGYPYHHTCPALFFKSIRSVRRAFGLYPRPGALRRLDSRSISAEGMTRAFVRMNNNKHNWTRQRPFQGKTTVLGAP
jgi:hypothetical protein